MPAEVDRPAARSEARVALLIAFSALGVALGSPRPATSLAIAAAAAIHLLASGVRPRVLVHGVAHPLVLGVGAAVLRILVSRGAPGPSSISLGHQLTFSREALAQAELLLCRISGASLVGLWLLSRVELDQLLGAFAWLRLPRHLLEIVALASRYQHVLRENAETVRAAQVLRLGYEGMRRSLAAMGVLMGSVACRAIDQAAATSEAMLLRGDQGRIWLPEPVPPGVADGVLAAAAMAVISASAALSWGSR